MVGINRLRPQQQWSSNREQKIRWCCISLSLLHTTLPLYNLTMSRHRNMEDDDDVDEFLYGAPESGKGSEQHNDSAMKGKSLAFFPFDRSRTDC